jgi:Helix-turn-helix domain
MPNDASPQGRTPNEVARLLRVSPDRIRAWIQSGQLQALNVAAHQVGKPRYIVLPHHLAAFEQARAAAQPKPPPRRKKQTGGVDFFPD